MIYKSCKTNAEEVCPNGFMVDQQSEASTSGGTNPHTGMYDYGSTTYTWKVVCK